MRTRTGTVIANSNDKTIVVRAERYVTHPIYKKRYRLSKKLHAHDEKNEAQVGDIVEISECRPFSKKKTWKLEKVTDSTNRIIKATPGAVEHAEEAEMKEVAQVEKEAPKVEEKKAEEKPAEEEFQKEEK